MHFVKIIQSNTRLELDGKNWPDFEWIWTILTVTGAYKNVWDHPTCFNVFCPFYPCLMGQKVFLSVLWEFVSMLCATCVLWAHFALPCSLILPVSFDLLLVRSQFQHCSNDKAMFGKFKKWLKWILREEELSSYIWGHASYCKWACQ